MGPWFYCERCEFGAYIEMREGVSMAELTVAVETAHKKHKPDCEVKTSLLKLKPNNFGAIERLPALPHQRIVHFRLRRRSSFEGSPLE